MSEIERPDDERMRPHLNVADNTHRALYEPRWIVAVVYPQFTSAFWASASVSRALCGSNRLVSSIRAPPSRRSPRGDPACRTADDSWTQLPAIKRACSWHGSS